MSDSIEFRPTRVGRRGPDVKLLYLMNDFVVQEHVCNLRCKYCLNFENELKGDKPWVPPEDATLLKGSYGWDRAREVLSTYKRFADAPILRFSGGEILAVDGAVDFILEHAHDWARVQLLTNGTLLTPPTLERLASIETLNVCCSIDGHTPELNTLRVKSQRWSQRIVDGMLAVVRRGIPVELNMVLTQLNVGAIREFAVYLRDLPRRADLRLMPFPVRGKVGFADGFAVAASQLKPLEQLLHDYDEFREILPPRLYLERLLDFYATARRSHACRVPLSFLQSFDDGVLASCSNCWASSLGNVLEDADALSNVGRANIHKLFLRDPPRFPFCRSCFTPFDVVNVYFSGDCTLSELGAMDLYSTPEVQSRLLALKTVWDEQGPQAVWAGDDVRPVTRLHSNA